MVAYIVMAVAFIGVLYLVSTMNETVAAYLGGFANLVQLWYYPILYGAFLVGVATVAVWSYYESRAAIADLFGAQFSGPTAFMFQFGPQFFAHWLTRVPKEHKWKRGALWFGIVLFSILDVGTNLHAVYTNMGDTITKVPTYLAGRATWALVYSAAIEGFWITVAVGAVAIEEFFFACLSHYAQECSLRFGGDHSGLWDALDGVSQNVNPRRSSNSHRSSSNSHRNNNNRNRSNNNRRRQQPVTQPLAHRQERVRVNANGIRQDDIIVE